MKLAKQFHYLFTNEGFSPRREVNGKISMDTIFELLLGRVDNDDTDYA